MYMGRIGALYSLVLIFLIVTTSSVFADPTSAGSILSEERQQTAQRDIQKMQASPPDEEAKASPELITEPETDISKPESEPETACQ